MENIKIKITVRDYGEMEAELYPDKAPVTVENFVSLIKKDFFSGLIFHRVIEGFMIQGGGYTEQFEDTVGKFSARENALAEAIKTGDFENAEAIANAVLLTLPPELKNALNVGGGVDVAALSAQVGALTQQAQQQAQDSARSSQHT